MVCKWVALAIVVIAISVPGLSLAQDSAAGLLPPPEAIGEGWTLIEERGPLSELDPSFAEMARGVYAGPDGGRVAINAYIVAEGSAAIRKSWEITTESYDTARFNFDFDFSLEQQADNTPLPNGCVDGRRSAGTDKVFGSDFVVGFAICAADPNIILWVVTSGEVNGLTGFEAADAVTAATLEAVGTPTP